MSNALADSNWAGSLDVLPGTPGEWVWLIFGLCGNIAFFTRFLVQWIHSERHKESRIPPIFWWQSLVGTFILLAYFIHKREIVGVLGYIVNVVPYTRNLMLIYRKRRQQAEQKQGFPVVQK